MSHKPENEYIAQTHNTARFFTEHRQIAFVAADSCLRCGVGTDTNTCRSARIRGSPFAWPWPARNGPARTPKRLSNWSCRPVEQTMAQSPFIQAPLPSDFGIRSIQFPGLSLVYVQLDDSVTDTKKQFADINLKLNALSEQVAAGCRSHPVQQRFRRHRGTDVDGGKSTCQPGRYHVTRQVRGESAIRKTRAAEFGALTAAAHSASCTHFQYLLRLILVRDSLAAVVRFGERIDGAVR